MDEKRKTSQPFARTFPPEIWLRIHRFATFVPNAFDKDVPDPFSYPPPLSQDEIQDEMRRSLRMKRSLVLVCKLWNELCTRFLYEAVYVGRIKTLQKMEYLLAEGEKGRTKTAMERWTRRLDIAIRDPRKGDHRSLQVAVHLLFLMKNLEICVARKVDMKNLFCRKLLMLLSVSSRKQLVVYDSIHELYDGPESKARTLDEFNLCDSDWDTRYNSIFWLDDFRKFKSLRRLNLTPGKTPLASVQIIRRLMVPMLLPCLQFLYLCDRFPCYVDVRGSDSLAISSPFHLVYCGHDAGFVKEFVSRSPGLSSRIMTFEWETTSMVELGPFLNTIAEHCPNLQNLILVFRTWDSSTLGLTGVTLPKSIRRLGLRSIRPEGKRLLMRELCNVLSQVVETSKSLELVRFMGFQTVRNLRDVNPEITRQMKLRLDVKNILLEAFDGQPLLH